MTGHTDVMHTVNLPSITINLSMAEDGTPRGAILYGTDEERLFKGFVNRYSAVPCVFSFAMLEMPR